MIDPLAREMMRATLALGFKAYRGLVAAGVPHLAAAQLRQAGALGRVRAIEGERFWEPQEDGEPRLALAVHSCGELVDIAAFSPAAPDRWTLRRGDGVMLGDEALWHACAMAGPGVRTVLPVHATPMDWLRAGCEGVCVLDWGAEALALLRQPGPHTILLASSEAAAAKLREALAYGALPKVAAVPAGRMAA